MLKSDRLKTLKLNVTTLQKSLPLLLGILYLITPSDLLNSILKLRIVQADIDND